MESKIRHLEIIQSTIGRMSTNSFFLKGWSVTLVSALFALSSQNTDKRYFLIAYIPVFVFWVLDGYFLSQERQYRELYDKVRLLPNNKVDFDMKTKQFGKNGNAWGDCCISKTLAIFYGSLLGALVITTYLYCL